MNPSPPLEAGVVDALCELALVSKPPRFCPGCGAEALDVAPLTSTEVTAYDASCTACKWSGDISPDAGGTS